MQSSAPEMRYETYSGNNLWSFSSEIMSHVFYVFALILAFLVKWLITQILAKLYEAKLLVPAINHIEHTISSSANQITRFVIVHLKVNMYDKNTQSLCNHVFLFSGIS